MFLISYSESETIEFARKLGSFLKGNDLILLKGDLAAGKTAFTKGLALGLKINDIINSPTFVIHKSYEGRLRLEHIDAYRLLDNDYDLGLNELRDSESVLVIEWYEYLKELDIKDYLLIDFIYLDENTRKLVFTSDNDEYLKIVKELL